MELDATASVPFGQDSSAEHASFLGKVLATVQAAQEYADTTLVDENPYHYAGWEKDLEKGLGGGSPLSGTSGASVEFLPQPAEANLLSEFSEPELAPTVPPESILNKARLDDLLKHSDYNTIMHSLHHVAEDIDVQQVVDRLLQSGYGIRSVLLNIDKLPEYIHIPEEVIIAYVQKNPEVVISCIETGHLNGIDGRKFVDVIIQLLPVRTEAMRLLPRMLEAVGTVRLSIEEVCAWVRVDSISPRVLASIAGYVDGFDDPDVIAAADELMDWIMLSFVGTLPVAVQSAYFRYRLDSGAGLEYYQLGNFSQLLEEDYERILAVYADGFKHATKDERIGIFKNAPSHIIAQYEELADQERLRIFQGNRARAEQRYAEETYFEENNIQITPIESHMPAPEASEIYERLERDHCVRRPLRFALQMHDKSRTNAIEYATSSMSLGTDTHTASIPKRQITEHEGLTELADWLRGKAAESMTRADGVSLYENLTYIGEKEYQEAVSGLAAYWKLMMDKNPALQLYIVGDDIEVRDYEYYKSTDYLLDRILACFTDDELEHYKGRLLLRESDIVNDDPQSLRAILIDDWTISGSQLREKAISFISSHPGSFACLEVNLLAASKERIALGLEDINAYPSNDTVPLEHISVPVRSYYMAHDAPLVQHDSARGVHITGSHSSVDFGFELQLEQMRDYGSHLPPPANIVRPYRQDGYATVHINRLFSVYGMQPAES